jgi:hypothetical protein
MQAQEFGCGTAPSSYTPVTPENFIPCFGDIQTLMDNQTPVYLRVNFHFFVSSDCTGSFDVNHTGGDDPNWPQTDAFFDLGHPQGFGMTERFITECNNILANPVGQKLPGGTYDPPVSFVPLRLALGDVRIYCNQAFKEWQGWEYYHTNYGQYAQPGINVYWSRPYVPGASGVGDFGGAGFNMIKDDNKLLLHELGHNLTLLHTFGFPDGCSDTPEEGVQWDKNCNGYPYDAGESNGCFKLLEPNDPWCTGAECATSTSPCCDPNNIYNNFMGYSESGTAITQCQIFKMLNRLRNGAPPQPGSGNFSCNWMAQIGGTHPPVTATLGFLPKEELENDCNFCIHGQASMNETRFHWILYEITNSQSPPVLFRDFGWKQGQAGSICLSPTSAIINHRVPSGKKYSMTLEVEDEWGNIDFQSVKFRIPQYTCDENVVGGSNDNPPDIPRINPNPGGGVINYSFDLLTTGPVTSSARQINGQPTYVPIYQNAQQIAGESVIEVNTDQWQSGIYAFRLVTSHGVYNTNFIKQ